jgi:hypothetical protein
MDLIRDKRGWKFGKLPTQVLYNPHLSSNAKCVYACLDQHANNDTTVSFPGQAYMSKRLGISQPTVSRAVLELRKFVAVKKIKTHKGQRNEYTLLPF